MTSPAPREQATAERDRRLLGWQAYDWMKTAVALLLAALLLYGALAGTNDGAAAPAPQPTVIAEAAGERQAFRGGAIHDPGRIRGDCAGIVGTEDTQKIKKGLQHSLCY